MRTTLSAPQGATPLRRLLLQTGGAALVGALATFHATDTHAQAEWPQRTIRLVVPYAPGGSSDTLGRMIARHLSDAFKQPVVVENKAGAGGMIGSQMVSKAPPDGYTLVISGIGSHVIAPVDSPGSFDPMKDFTHIALLGGPPIAMVVNAVQPIADFKGYIGHVSQLPKGLSWASPGQGTHGHLTGETFRAMAGLNMVHISYKGAGPAVADLLANQVPAGFMTLSSANAHVDTGKLRLLATTAPRRLPELPNTPTFAELGYPALTGTTWFGISGPPGMPAAVVDKLNAEIRRGLQTPAVRKQMALESMVVGDYDAAGFTRFVAAEIERWAPASRAMSARSK